MPYKRSKRISQAKRSIKTPLLVVVPSKMPFPPYSFPHFISPSHHGFITDHTTCRACDHRRWPVAGIFPFGWWIVPFRPIESHRSNAMQACATVALTAPYSGGSDQGVRCVSRDRLMKQKETVDGQGKDAWMWPCMGIGWEQWHLSLVSAGRKTTTIVLVLDSFFFKWFDKQCIS
jgi:hypothetical protein